MVTGLTSILFGLDYIIQGSSNGEYLPFDRTYEKTCESLSDYGFLFERSIVGRTFLVRLTTSDIWTSVLLPAVLT